jgi:hypothetical protein
MPAIDVAHQHLLTARSLHQAQLNAGTARYSEYTRGRLGSANLTDHLLDTLDWSSIVMGSRVAAGLDAVDSQKVTLRALYIHLRLLKITLASRRRPGRLRMEI